MTSGFRDYTEKSTDPFGQILLDPQKEWTAQELAPGGGGESGHPARGVPLLQHQLHRPGDLVTRVTGGDYATFVKDRILGSARPVAHDHPPHTITPRRPTPPPWRPTAI